MIIAAILMEIVEVKDQGICMLRADAQIDCEVDEHHLVKLFEVAEALNDPEYRDLRRAPRQPVDIRVWIYGHGVDGKPFHAEARTVNVSDTGALLLIGVTLSCGDEILIRHTTGSKERKGTIVRFAGRRGGLEEVGVAFSARDVEFWKTGGCERCDNGNIAGPQTPRKRRAWNRQGAL